MTARAAHVVEVARHEEGRGSGRSRLALLAVTLAACFSPVVQCAGTQDLTCTLSLDVNCNCLAVSPDGTRVALGLMDGGVEVRDAREGGVIATLPGDTTVTALAFSPDGQFLAEAVLITPSIKLWDVASKQVVRIFGGEDEALSWTALTFSPDGLLLAASSFGGVVYVAAVATGTTAKLFPSHVSQNPSSSDSEDDADTSWMAPLFSPAARFYAAAFSPDGRVLAVGTCHCLSDAYMSAGQCADGAIETWDTTTWEESGNYLGPDHAVVAIAYSSDGESIAGSTPDGDVFLWDASTRETIRDLPGYVQELQALDFSADGRLLVAASRESSSGVPAIWDASTGERLAQVTGHTERIRDIAIAPDGLTLITASSDGTVKFWDVAGLAETKSESSGAIVTPPPTTKVLPLPSGVSATEESDQLVLEATGAFVPAGELSSQVAAELEVIRTAYAEVAGIYAMPSWSMTSILGSLEDDAYAAYQSQSYTAWNELNKRFGLTRVEILSEDLGIFALRFSAHYNAPLLAVEYAAVPGLRYAEPNFVGGDGDDVCLCFDGDAHVYVFDQGTGDCPAGCIEHTYWGVRVRVEGATAAIEPLGRWEADYVGEKPEWLQGLCDGTRWL